MSRRRGRGRRSGRGPARGELYPTLDLHGEPGEEAVRRTRQWLLEEQHRGTRTVRVITGRGLNSPGPPVLRHEVESLLRSLRPQLVADFVATSAGGAFLVELQPPPGPTPRRALPAWVDPELRRRAEEALLDLGVRPTPELIEAEIRRLRRRKPDEPA